MSDQPRFSYNPDATIGVSQLAELLYEQNPIERENIVQKARFPRRIPNAAYSQSKRIISGFLARNGDDADELLMDRDFLQSCLDAEPNEHRRLGYRQDIGALESFIATFQRYRLDRIRFSGGRTRLSTDVEGTRVKTQLDAQIEVEARGGVTRVGGLLVFTSQSDVARKNIVDRLPAMAAMIHWLLRESETNISPLPRVCVVADLGTRQVIPSPNTYSRLENRIQAMCRYITGHWHLVPPPSGYDGPAID